MAFVKYDGCTYEDLQRWYGSCKDFPAEKDVRWACVNGDGYSESLTIVWSVGKKLFETADSHCSCNGFGDGYDYFDGDKEISLKAVKKFVGGASIPDHVLEHLGKKGYK